MTGDDIAAAVQTGEANGWLVFTRPASTIEAWTAADVTPAIHRGERAARDGAYVVGALAYEAGAAFGFSAHAPLPGLPLAQFTVFPPERVARLADVPAGEPYAIGDLEPSIGRADFRAVLDRIRGAIAAGDTYQVNYTFRLRGRLSGDPVGLLGDLVQAQRCRYGAFVRSGRYVIVSASPELFVARDGGRLVARPMKGTAPREPTSDGDRAARDALIASAKDRAENVMVVDMVRNDLGRIAQVGSVEVPALFTAEAYPNVWQLTSTVTARSEVSLADLLAAAFPSASVTGAPKVRTTEIIRALEPGPRGIYTGAVGVIEPGGRFRFNVAIRTALVDLASDRLEFGVGSGVVWDSDPDREYDESLLKGAVLGRRPEAFDLLETLRWTPQDGFALLDRHLARLAASAEYFAIPFDADRARAALSGAVSGATAPRRVRLLVSPGGAVRIESAALAPPPSGPLRLGFAADPIDPRDPFLCHKTTNRRVYDHARRADVDDVILWNPAGEATETTVGNLVVERRGRRVTPAVGCGLLPGTMRAELLVRGEIEEGHILVGELAEASCVWLINSVRGWQPAHVVDIHRRKG